MIYGLNFVLILLVGVFGCVQAADSDEWRLVFGLRGATLAPNETLELLNKIKQTSPYDYQVRDLLEANDVQSQRKCNTRTFQSIDSLIKANAAYTRSVVPYLNQCKENALEFCKKIFTSELQLDIDRFPEKVVPDMSLFREKVFSVGPIDKPLLMIPQKNIEEGTAAFMRVQAEEFVSKINDHTFDEFSGKLEEFVGALCNEVEDACPSRNFLALLQYDNGVFFKKLDKNSQEWLVNVKICLYVNENYKTLTSNVHNLLVGDE